MNLWWTDKDAAIFEQRKQDFVAYYNRFHTTDSSFENGERTLGENMADFAGMCIIMDLLEGDAEAQREALMGFAGNLAALNSWVETIDGQVVPDAHAAPNVRVNAVTASLDAFYELYDIDEFDEMYVAPEERLKLW